MKKMQVVPVTLTASMLVVGVPAVGTAVAAPNPSETPVASTAPSWAPEGWSDGDSAWDDHFYHGDDPYSDGGFDDPGAEGFNGKEGLEAEEDSAQVQPKLKVQSTKHGQRLRIKVRPKWSDGDYTLVVLRRHQGDWTEHAVVQTSGHSESATVKVSRGKYRVDLPVGQNGLDSASSDVIRVHGQRR
jgi:hypothetical protein